MTDKIFGVDFADQPNPTAASTISVHDGTGLKDVTLENLFKVISGLTAETSPATADLLAFYDASALAARGITFENFLKVITALTAETAPATGDELALYDASAAAARKMTLQNALKVINALTADSTPDRAADYVLTYDASAADVKKVLLSLIPQKEWTAFTPVWTNLTVGNGTQSGAYVRIGDFVMASISLTFGTTTSISGAVFVQWPVTPVTYLTDQPLGDLAMRDVSLPGTFLGIAAFSSTTNCLLRAMSVSGSNISLSNISSSSPFAWASGDLIALTMIYRAA